MTQGAITAADLRPFDLFDDLGDAELEPWAAAARPLSYAPGETMASQDEAVAGVQLLMEGRASSLMRAGDTVDHVGSQVAPTWMGAIAALTEEPFGVTVEAEVDCRVALLPTADFQRLVLADPRVHRRVMRVVGPVASRLAAVEGHRERLASLGTMAAGLAHELNNPAAAAQRAAAQMRDALADVSAALGGFVEHGIERDGAAAILALHRDLLARAEGRSALSALDAADAEDELGDRLDELGVAEGWQLAEPLAAAGADADWVDAVAAAAGPAVGVALRWTAATLVAGGLADELQESTRRMSDLVGAIKDYTHLDRGGAVDVDLHDGLETTLRVLGHKLKHTAIEVVRDYDRDLPTLVVHGAELNQVWTNLLDNAIGALGERGTITLRTRRDGACARVEVADDGPGIPDDVRDRIFDAFFTTKGVGQGTGLGLSTARQIVVDRHGGSLTVDSRPGETTFTVWLPFGQALPVRGG